MKFTRFAVRRRAGNGQGFFRVDVPEAGQRGVGFQLRFRGVDFGVSLIWGTDPSTGRRW